MKALFIISTDDADNTYNAMRLANVAVKKGADGRSIYLCWEEAFYLKKPATTNLT